MLFFILLVIGIACIFIYNYIDKHTYHDTIIPSLSELLPLDSLSYLASVGFVIKSKLRQNITP